MTITTRVCIAGGGPAGMMLGLLLARGGIDVTVLEKHADFLRDFRGDTVHPSTMEVMHELGILDGFLARPHSEVRSLGARIGEHTWQVADFSRLNTRCRFIAMMPQWHFLDFIAEEARKYPAFHLMMSTEAVELIRVDGIVAGVRARRGADSGGEADAGGDTVDIRADLVVAADGRFSTLRGLAGLVPDDLGAPFDVLWLRLSRHESDPPATLGGLDAGKLFIMVNRGEYWQCAWAIPKGTLEQVRAAGLEAFRAGILEIAPYFADRVHELASWDDIKLLNVQVNRLPRWDIPGMLCIGDAAHAMSPVGGVGVNLAIQDAVATANILGPVLRRGKATQDDLRAVQRRREFPTKVTQQFQVLIQEKVISNVLHGTEAPTAPLPLRVLQRLPWLQRFPARMIGIGVRPEHVTF